MSDGENQTETTPAPKTQRKMVRSELLGRHAHPTSNGVTVNISRRDGTFLARGYLDGKPFGAVLGEDQREAESRLRQILCQIEEGTYERPSEARKRPIRRRTIPNVTLRDLVVAHLSYVRMLRGKRTADNYADRLTPVLAFNDLPDVRRKYPTAAHINLEYAMLLRPHLFGLRVTPSGHPMADSRQISARHVYNILGTMSALLNRARQPEIGLLPASYANPFTRQLVGMRPTRDPLAPPKVPMDLRVKLVGCMDLFELCTLGLAMVLPHRHEDYTGLLVTDVLWERRHLNFGTRMGGGDFNKGRQCYHVPFPPEIAPLLLWLAGDRTDGPLIRRRTILNGRRTPSLLAGDSVALARAFDRLLTEAGDQVQTEQDRKRLFRQMLRRAGGAADGDLSRAFQVVMARASGGMKVRFHDCRGSVTTDLKNAGVDTVLRKYVTGHSIKGEILAEYESQDLELHMAGYFKFIRPLLDAIARRTRELDLTSTVGEVTVPAPSAAAPPPNRSSQPSWLLDPNLGVVPPLMFYAAERNSDHE